MSICSCSVPTFRVLPVLFLLLDCSFRQQFLQLPQKKTSFQFQNDCMLVGTAAVIKMNITFLHGISTWYNTHSFAITKINWIKFNGCEFIDSLGWSPSVRRKSIVVDIKFIFGSFGHKTKGNCVYHENAEKQGSFDSSSLSGTLNVNWWDNNSLRVLVVLHVEVTPVATPHLIRFVLCYVDGCEWTVFSGRTTYHIGNNVFTLI